MNTPFIVWAKRTPVGKIDGILKQTAPESMAAVLMKQLIEDSKIEPADIDDVILGNVVGPGGNIARLSLLTAGIPVSVPGVTVDRQCGSGLEAIHLAARMIQAGAGDIYIAGGTESTSLAPWKMEKPKNLHKGTPKLYERARFSPDFIGDPSMGEAAENVAQQYGITRKEQDQFAVDSHRKAAAAEEQGVFAGEIAAVPGVKSDRDECVRKRTTMKLLQRLPALFREDGTVTAGNSCPVNDGASVVLMMSKQKAERLGLKPIAEVVDTAIAGVDPNILGIGPVPAVQTCLRRNGLTMDDIDVMEFNEAFASQVLASLYELRMPLAKVNVSGGGIALGHPYGASGAIITTRLMTEMVHRCATWGIATMGIGGGMGIAVLFKRIAHDG
ncbi:acetyl-CoA C-acetyltransferase [Alteribacillus persepolensis]|uniref:Acetyl-CoA C-acetyltransferase n=1 Tax=Alteribacillus persepolensis TaxID=568899 RepID=A0A1G8EUD5_9BACI|nr:thiolase family protein [Alteribacillus persepolensis]SDH73511.1 acetyl-CoA C-acetyltransferase [Alteribacillus persepolensis]